MRAPKHLLADIVPIPGTQQVKPVFDSADLVCYCLVKSVTEAKETASGSTANRKIQFVLDLKDLYKETDKIKLPVTVEYEVLAAGVDGVPFQVGRSFLFFLKANPNRSMTLADPFLGATFFGSIPIQSTGSGIEKLQDALTETATRADNDDGLRALQILEGFDSLSEHTVQTMKTLVGTRNSEIAFTALGVMLTTKSPASLSALATYLRTYQGKEPSWGIVTMNSRLAQFNDPKALPVAQELARSNYPPIREGAVRALRSMKDTRAVPSFVERLDDADNTIRYLAVISLAETLAKFDGDYAPTMYLFDRNPGYYASLWKQWWQDEGKYRFKEAL